MGRYCRTAITHGPYSQIQRDKVEGVGCCQGLGEGEGQLLFNEDTVLVLQEKMSSGDGWW